MKKPYPLVALIGFCACVHAQTANRFWSPIAESAIQSAGVRVIVPKKYKTFHLTGDYLKNALWSAPDDTRVKLQNSTVVIELPMPDGTMQKFRVVYSPVMAPTLAAKYPGIKSFDAMAIDNSGTYGKLDWTDTGLHAVIRKAGNDMYIDPFCRKNTMDYIVYNRSDYDQNPVKLSPKWTL